MTDLIKEQNKESMKGRDKHLDAVKGFAILIVMLGHCIGRNHMNDPYINDAIMSIQMPLFMMVSGYGTGMGKREIANGKMFLAVLKKRMTAYLLPFFSWVFVVSLFRPFDDIQNPFVECYNVLFRIDSGLWFLMTLFIIQSFTMLAALLANICTTHLKKSSRGICHMTLFLGGIAVVYFLFVLWGRSGSTFLGPSFVVQYMPFFVLGYIVSYYIKNVFFKKGRKFLWGVWVLSLMLFLGLVFVFDLQSKTNTKELLIQMLASLLGSFVCFYGVYHLPVKRKYGLSFIGLYTLEIYTLHFRFVDMLGFQNLGLEVYSLKGMGAIVITFLVMSILSAIIIYFVKKVWILDLFLFGKGKRQLS